MYQHHFQSSQVAWRKHWAALCLNATQWWIQVGCWKHICSLTVASRPWRLGIWRGRGSWTWAIFSPRPFPDAFRLGQPARAGKLKDIKSCFSRYLWRAWPRPATAEHVCKCLSSWPLLTTLGCYCLLANKCVVSRSAIRTIVMALCIAFKEVVSLLFDGLCGHWWFCSFSSYSWRPILSLLPWLQKPFTGQLDRKCERFNYSTNGCRMTVECALGRLKYRWKRVMLRLEADKK